MDVEKTIEFLSSNQAKHDERLGRLESVVTTLAASTMSLSGTVEQLTTTVELLADNIGRVDDALVSLAESEVKTI